MDNFKRFEELHAWQKSRELMRFVYVETGRGSLGQDFDLRKQLRRACLSVMANISEGFARRGDKEFYHFLRMARGSAAEIQSLLYVAMDFHAMDDATFRRGYNLADSCIAMIAGLMNHLKRKLDGGSE